MTPPFYCIAAKPPAKCTPFHSVIAAFLSGDSMATKAQKAKNDAAKAVRVNEKKWGKPLMAAGWTAFPSIILEKQHALGLSALDVNIILYLATYWWEAENKPHPSKKTIAQAIGVTPRTVQRRIADLEKAGFLRREYVPDELKGNKPNNYHFDGLIAEATPFAEEKIEEIEAKRAADTARRRRKRPALKSIKGGKSD